MRPSVTAVSGLSSLLLLIQGVVGCEGGEQPVAGERVMAAPAPLAALDESTDQADRSCQVVLRQASRPRSGPGYETDCSTGTCSYVWDVVVDVSQELIAQGGEPAVLYHSGSAPRWWQAEAEGVVEDTIEGYERFAFRISEHTVGPGMSMTSLMRTHIDIIPLVHLPAGGRLFDHNRVPGDFDNYELTAENGWTLQDDPGVCGPATAPTTLAMIEFENGWVERQHGPLIAGGEVRLSYELARLSACRGAGAWALEVGGRFWPGGQTFSGSLLEGAGPQGAPGFGSFETEVPQDAQELELWFHSWAPEDASCEDWDSRFGQNYRFEVLTPAAAPAPVQWAGDWGNGLWRGCTHRPGLDEPLTLDSYLIERACLDLYVDVYVPGLTDGAVERPEWIAAQVELQIDDSAPATAWLRFVERVGNNYRYRWSLPRSQLTHEPWQELRYAFRFSTDGRHWTRIATTDGPEGGPARTILRGFHRADWDE